MFSVMNELNMNQLKNVALGCVLILTTNVNAKQQVLEIESIPAGDLSSLASVEKKTCVEKMLSSENRYWTIRKDDKTLRDVFTRWSHEMGWQLAWEIDYDIEVNSQAELFTNMKSAVAKTLMGVTSSNNEIRAEFYKGNCVLKVFERD